MDAVIDGIILAAGLSSRMERPKPLLKVGPLTFLERAARTLRVAGCRRVYAVVNASAEWVGNGARELDLEIVANERPESEQIDSLRLALRQVGDDAAAVLVLPVDLPLVAEETAAALVAAYRATPAPLYLPFHNTVAGHPVLLGRELFSEILDTELEEGVRTLIMSHARDLREVKVVDPGILIDIDTPDDYWRYIEQK
jgi:molybdenum cofactor cytidylyltransferase